MDDNLICFSDAIDDRGLQRKKRQNTIPLDGMEDEGGPEGMDDDRDPGDMEDEGGPEGMDGGPGGEDPGGSYGTQPTSVAEEMEFLRTFMTLNEEERTLIGHNYTSFIKGCTFRGRDCFNES